MLQNTSIEPPYITSGVHACAYARILYGAVPPSPPMMHMAFSFTAPSNLRCRISSSMVQGSGGWFRASAFAEHDPTSCHHYCCTHRAPEPQSKQHLASLAGITMLSRCCRSYSHVTVHSRNVQQQLWVIWITSQGVLRWLRALRPGFEHVLAAAVHVFVEATYLYTQFKNSRIGHDRLRPTCRAEAAAAALCTHFSSLEMHACGRMRMGSCIAAQPGCVRPTAVRPGISAATLTWLWSMCLCRL